MLRARKIDIFQYQYFMYSFLKKKYTIFLLNFCGFRPMTIEIATKPNIMRAIMHIIGSANQFPCRYIRLLSSKLKMQVSPS